MDIFEAVQKFLMYLTITRGMSPKTVEQYGRHMWAFLCFLHPEVRKIISKSFDLASFFLEKVSTQPEASENAPLIRGVSTGRGVSGISEISHQLEKVSWMKTEHINQDLCDNFRLSLSRGDISIGTVNAYMISLRAFLHFCKKSHIPTGVEFSDIELNKSQERKVEYLTTEELQNIVKSIGTEDIVDIRDRAIIFTIYSTGLRVSELAALDIKNVNLDTMEFAILGKGRKVRVVYLTEWAAEAIREYLEKRDDHFPALFLKHGFKKMKNEKGKMKNESESAPLGRGVAGGRGVAMGNVEFEPDKVRLNRFLITKMITARALKAGIIKPVSAHTIRHSFATTLLGNGADLRSIQELLGHKNIATTQVYTHVTNKQLKEVHGKFHV